jgi:hypothetical protein
MRRLGGNGLFEGLDKSFAQVGWGVTEDHGESRVPNLGQLPCRLTLRNRAFVVPTLRKSRRVGQPLVSVIGWASPPPPVGIVHAKIKGGHPQRKFQE